MRDYRYEEEGRTRVGVHGVDKRVVEAENEGGMDLIRAVVVIERIETPCARHPEPVTLQPERQRL